MTLVWGRHARVHGHSAPCPNIPPRYGMVWYGMVWYGMVWYGMVWYGMVWYGMVWYGMVWYGMVWYGMVWYGMVWYGMVWYGMVWYEPQLRAGPAQCFHGTPYHGWEWGVLCLLVRIIISSPTGESG